MTRRNLGPLDPIFPQRKQTGSIQVGNASSSELTPQPISVVGFVTHATDLNGAQYVAVGGGYAFVGCLDGNRLTSVDVSDPASPVVVQSLSVGQVKGGVIKDGNYCYVGLTSGSHTIRIVDVSNPASMSIVGSVLATGAYGNGIAKQGNYVYVHVYDAFDAWFDVIDVSTPSAPVQVGTLGPTATLYTLTSNEGTSVVVDGGDYCYVAVPTANRIAVIDVSNPSSPSIVATLTDSTNLSDVRGITKDDDFIYACCGASDRITVVDVSDPLSPSVHASYQNSIFSTLMRIEKSSDHCFVTDHDGDGVYPIDVSDPGAPVADTEVVVLDGPTGLVRVGNYLYVACRNNDRLSILYVAGW